MGSFLSKPVTVKESNEYSCPSLQCGCTGMQGWRQGMEDASIVCLNLQSTSKSLFGVFDGHGGSEVALYSAKHFLEELQKTQYWLNDELTEALRSVFLELDEIVRRDETLTELEFLADEQQKKVSKWLEELVSKEEENYIYKINEDNDNDDDDNDDDNNAKNKIQTECNEVIIDNSDSIDILQQSRKKTLVKEKKSLLTGNVVNDDQANNDLWGEDNSIKGGDNDEEEEEDEDEEEQDCVDLDDLDLTQISQLFGDRLIKSLIRGSINREMDDEEEDEEEEEEEDEDEEEEEVTDSKGENDATLTEVSDIKAKEQIISSEVASKPVEHIENDKNCEHCVDKAQINISKEKKKKMKLQKLEKKLLRPGFGSGCTAVVGLVDQMTQTLIVANAGDSRCVLCRDGKAFEMSFDHKPTDKTEKARIEKAGGKVVEDRVEGDLNLSRAIGDHRYKRNQNISQIEQMIIALPDIKEISLTSSDSFMVLASDGIWNFLDSQQVIDFVKNRMQKSSSLSSICEELCDVCLAPNIEDDTLSTDNMTVIIVKFCFENHLHVADLSTQVENKENSVTLQTSSPSIVQSGISPHVNENEENDLDYFSVRKKQKIVHLQS